MGCEKDRAHDETTLLWLQMSDEGHSGRAIAKHTGFAPGTVNRALKAIREADAEAQGGTQ